MGVSKITKRSKDAPISEITLRRYERPFDLTDRELVRKLCLSFGLLQPGDSRDIVVDVVYVILSSGRDKVLMGSEEIRDKVIGLRKHNNLSVNGTASSNIRRQIKRLREMHLVEKVKNNYRITEFDSLSNIFATRIETYLLSTVKERVLEYASKVDKEFGLERWDHGKEKDNQS
ncbi:hypothetical protein JW968_02275 [Candidatus Woesearchaeota archaeon]|nr:hypothetical protein [Candidatus Woesearchaeota archaeon]